MEEQDDPFASLTKRCKPTPSQEEILKTCPFRRQSEFFPGDGDGEGESQLFGGIPVAPTGIVMVSPPDEFQTPPEDSLPTASSENQRPQPPSAVDGGGGENVSCVDAERAVDLGKDSDNFVGSSEVNSTEVVDGVDGVLGGFDPTIADKEAVITESSVHVYDTDVMTEVLDVEVEEMGEQPDEDNVFVDLPLRETEVDNHVALSEGDEMVRKNGNGDLGRKNIEDLDKFRYVGPSRIVNRKVADVGGRRELPASITKGANVAGEETGQWDLAAKDKIFKGLLDALTMVAGQLGGGGSQEEKDVDFLETVKRRGMTFPRPRWWPPEGYDD